ncbi:hypothetical protein [Nocardioides sp. Soil805]|uniref:hypothetical protein n=1 Tax=Nocardioides sp. Soil805 TaxID=1736416 RepID=UPI00070242DD|nr:hypothetical protein [Nocardioides sp. Soil805]KRF34103.1 hypothetical protein ASG94_15290 [Nocardioides sp. Soil805]
MTVRRPLALALAVTAVLAGLAAPAGASETGTEAPARAAQRTTLTFEVADCEGCTVQLVHAMSTLDADEPHVWISRERTVQDGSVTFRPLTRRTHGLSATVVAPWEGHTGYVTTVAFRYGGESVGDEVTLAQAVTEKKASACWEGTRRRSLTLPLVVEEVEVQGVKERVPGSIAFVPTTQSWLRPMRQAWDGVLGSQDVNICG